VVAKQFGVGGSAINSIRHKRTWGWVT
jgi:hypothetical protein